MFLKEVKDTYKADDFVPVTIQRVKHLHSDKFLNKFIIYVNDSDAFGLLSENYSYISSKALATKLTKEGYLVKNFTYSKGYMLVTLYSPEWPVLDMNEDEKQLLNLLTNNKNVMKLTNPQSVYRVSMFFLNNYSGESKLRIGFSLLIADEISLPVNKLSESYVHMGNLIEDIKSVKEPENFLQKLRNQSGYDLLTYLKHVALTKTDVKLLSATFEELNKTDPSALEVLTALAILLPHKAYSIVKSGIDLLI